MKRTAYRCGGHDFRSEYTQLQFLKERFPHTPVLALMATADKLTRCDIVNQLALRDPKVFIASFNRPNIRLTMFPGQQRLKQIVQFLQAHPNQPGIIYYTARKTCELLAEKLKARGFRAACFPAELPPERRHQVQDDFIYDRTLIVCATVAFGMGIDKSNVRFVIHYNLLRNVESYYHKR